MESWHKETFSYDLISCLNVLDRCDQPLSLLRRLHGKLKDGGVLILAVVFPFKPFVEKGETENFKNVYHSSAADFLYMVNFQKSNY